MSTSSVFLLMPYQTGCQGKPSSQLRTEETRSEGPCNQSHNLRISLARTLLVCPINKGLWQQPIHLRVLAFQLLCHTSFKQWNWNVDSLNNLSTQTNFQAISECSPFTNSYTFPNVTRPTLLLASVASNSLKWLLLKRNV